MHRDTLKMLDRLTALLIHHAPKGSPVYNDDGKARADAEQLRRISMTLHRWHELECGDGNGHIERQEDHSPWCTAMFAVDSADHGPCNCAKGKPRYYNDRARYLGANDVRRGSIIPDREAGALKRLAAVMARYPSLTSYVQGDPRGCALYILRPGDVPEGATVDSCYSRGLAVHQ